MRLWFISRARLCATPSEALRGSFASVLADQNFAGEIADGVMVIQLAGGKGPPELGDRDAHLPLGLALEVGGPLLRREADDRRRGPCPGELCCGSTQRL